LYYVKKRVVWGRLYIPTYFFLSLHIKKEEKKRKELGVKDLIMYANTSSGVIDGGG
jgi:hypothetical protein